MKRLDLKIGFDCNNHCLFCAQGHKRDAVKRKTLKEITALLIKAKKQGVSGVVFTGGEPTMHPELPEAVSKARSLGFYPIQVQTNGRRLAYSGYCQELKKAGVTEFGPSLHGSSPALHEKLTKAAGSFKEVVQGIINCKKLDCFVLTNSVITALNYKDLPELARLLLYLKVDQYQLAFVHIIGTAWENRQEIVPKKTAALPYIKEALDKGLKAGIPCYTEAIPFCLMKNYEACVAERVIPEGPVADAAVYVESYGDYRRNEGKSKTVKCRRCACFSGCEGPWREYTEFYGWSEFKPIGKTHC